MKRYKFLREVGSKIKSNSAAGSASKVYSAAGSGARIEEIKESK